MTLKLYKIYVLITVIALFVTIAILVFVRYQSKHIQYESGLDESLYQSAITKCNNHKLCVYTRNGLIDSDTVFIIKQHSYGYLDNEYIKLTELSNQNESNTFLDIVSYRDIDNSKREGMEESEISFRYFKISNLKPSSIENIRYRLSYLPTYHRWGGNNGEVITESQGEVIIIEK